MEPGPPPLATLDSRPRSVIPDEQFARVSLALQPGHDATVVPIPQPVFESVEDKFRGDQRERNGTIDRDAERLGIERDRDITAVGLVGGNRERKHLPKKIGEVDF